MGVSQGRARSPTDFSEHRLSRCERTAHNQNRTDDLLLTMEMLYQLSYVGKNFAQQNLKRETRLELATLSLEG